MSVRNIEILVDKYPGNPEDDGKLYRSPQGIIYTGANNGVSVLGYDKENVGIILPIDSDDIQALIPTGVIIDDSLARKCQPTGGLPASCFQKVGGTVIYVPIYQPISLFKRVLDYIIETHNQKKFDLDLLPAKFKDRINFSLKLRDKLNELSESEFKNNTLIERFGKSYLDKMAGIKSTHQRLISILNNNFSMDVRKLEDNHFQAMKELKGAAADEDAKILAEIDKLTTLILKSS